MQLQRPSFFQEQRLKMNPQLFQSIKLMELPVMDLREKIEEELELNPALEVLEDRGTVSLDEATAPPEEEEYFESTSDSGFLRRNGGSEAADEHHRFIEGALSRPETLQQHLLWQLQLEPVSGELRAVAEILIQNLDDDGFHKEPPETLFKKNGAFPAVSPSQLAGAMRLVQSLDPVGCCVAAYREALGAQIALLDDVPDGLENALDYLELLERGKFAEAAKKMNRGEDEVKQFFERIRELSPFPGRRFSPGEVRYVVPDIQVVREEGDFLIILNDEVIPVLGINPFFKKLDPGDRRARNSKENGSGSNSRPAEDFARENIREAKVFIHSVHQRNRTLLRVAKKILEFQRSFFVNGPKYLAPLTLGDIAKELNLHETTVSRTANGKYMQTEWGIFEIRYFFTNSISGAGSGGSRYSKEGVKAIIQEIVGAGNRNLSDQDISELLARRGIPLARRTVAKYRKELDLGSSYTR